jgi:hypothetical protein
VRSLEQLIWAHPRYRIQAKVFLTRHDDKADVVLARGEEFQLGVAGNHCQGAIFLDGADLITPEFEDRIDEISRSFQGAQDKEGNRGAIDFGRYDIRYETDEALKRGEDFAIVELNGVLSESTNMYDPRRPVWWMYGVLFSQWRRLFRLGAQRRRLGGRALSIKRLIKIVAEHHGGRSGSSISD